MKQEKYKYSGMVLTKSQVEELLSYMNKEEYLVKEREENERRGFEVKVSKDD